MIASFYLRGEADLEPIVLRTWYLVAIWSERSQTVTYDMRFTRNELGALEHAYGLLRRTCVLLECRGDLFVQGQLHCTFSGLDGEMTWHIDQ